MRDLARILALTSLLWAPHTAAQPVATDAQPATGAFERDFAVGAYFSSWSGDYGSTGAGLRLRWEPLDELGVEVYTEVVDVDVPHASRLDIPSGFNLYVPITLFRDTLRVRPLVGLCTILSFVSDDTIAQASSDDVLFGAHAGLGFELSVTTSWSLFLDATYRGYFGHERKTDAWTASISRELATFDYVQVGAGLQLHL